MQPPNFSWDPLVAKACSNYKSATGVSPAIEGFHGQVLNIVCAAAKSMNPCCAPMFRSYHMHGCGGNWAGPFIQYVFNVSCNPQSQ